MGLRSKGFYKKQVPTSRYNHPVEEKAQKAKCALLNRTGSRGGAGFGKAWAVVRDHGCRRIHKIHPVQMKLWKPTPSSSLLPCRSLGAELKRMRHSPQEAINMTPVASHTHPKKNKAQTPKVFPDARNEILRGQAASASQIRSYHSL